MSRKRGIVCLKESIKARKSCKVDLGNPVSIFDFSEKLGVEVKFRPETSLEGMYFKNEKVILVSSHRPFGRQAFTCAHELGHHVFNHSTSVDSIVDGDLFVAKSEEESEADLFAAHLLMPLIGIKKAFKIRGWTSSNLKTHQAYSMASLFGVTYNALITHLFFNLRFISRSDYDRLNMVTPKSIKSSLLGFEYSGEFTVVDRFWSSRPIDLICGQYAILTKSISIDGLRNVELLSEKKRYFVIKATKQMVCETTLHDRPLHLRVSGSQDERYVGRNVYRYLEEPSE